MSGSIRWLIGMMMLYMILTILGNMLDMQPSYLTVNDTNIVGNSTGYGLVQTVGSSGATGPIWSIIPNTADAWWKALSWNFSFWKEYDPVTHTLVDSPLKIFYYVLFWPLSVGMVVLIVLTLRQILFGQ